MKSINNKTIKIKNDNGGPLPELQRRGYKKGSREPPVFRVSLRRRGREVPAEETNETSPPLTRKLRRRVRTGAVSGVPQKIDGDRRSGGLRVTEGGKAPDRGHGPSECGRYGRRGVHRRVSAPEHGSRGPFRPREWGVGSGAPRRGVRTHPVHPSSYPRHRRPSTEPTPPVGPWDWGRGGVGTSGGDPAPQRGRRERDQ